MLAFLDNDPINEGHVLVISIGHYSDINELPENVLIRVMQLCVEIVKALKTIYKIDGYTIMNNGGEFTDYGHFHVHVIPRYINDGFTWQVSDEKNNFNQEIADRISVVLNNIVIL